MMNISTVCMVTRRSWIRAVRAPFGPASGVTRALPASNLTASQRQTCSDDISAIFAQIKLKEDVTKVNKLAMK